MYKRQEIHSAHGIQNRADDILTQRGRRVQCLIQMCIRDRDNIDGLVRELVRVKMLPVPLIFSTLQDVFIYLNALPKKIVVVIDEYPLSLIHI